MCSRLCHDLAGLTGAVNNGIELMTEMGASADPEAMELVTQSAKEMAGRLQFYRVAFGMAPGVAKSVGDAQELARQYYGEGKVKLDWGSTTVDTQQAFDEAEIKLLLNLLLLANDALPRGGVLGVGISENAGRLQVLVAAGGTGARPGDEMQAALDRELTAEAVTARTVLGYFTACLAESLGLQLAIEQPESDAVTISARS